MTDLILYTTDDGRSQIKLRAEQQTVWLTQLEMADLFDATKQNISLHLKNIFEDGELTEASVVKESLTTAADGKRYQTLLYNLEAILAVGYRVRSPRGVQFRRWASTVLKEYLVKGFSMDDERLKNPDGRPDYFDEMLARIRDIRASEKRFYQKVRDLFALCVDYDKTDAATQTFFATVQNQLLYAVTQKTAAELITARANSADAHFGLSTWKGNKVTQDGYRRGQELSDRGRNRHPEPAGGHLPRNRRTARQEPAGDAAAFLEAKRGSDHHLQRIFAAHPRRFRQS